MISAKPSQAASFCSKNKSQMFVHSETAYLVFTVTCKASDEKTIVLKLFYGASEINNPNQRYMIQRA